MTFKRTFMRMLYEAVKVDSALVDNRVNLLITTERNASSLYIASNIRRRRSLRTDRYADVKSIKRYTSRLTNEPLPFETFPSGDVISLAIKPLVEMAQRSATDPPLSRRETLIGPLIK